MSDSSLSVEKSLNGARWVFPDINEDEAARMAQVYGLPEFIARMLVARGVTPEKVEEHLYPTLKKHFPDPLSMAGMKKFADWAAAQFIDGKKFGIFADFDVDGSTSAAIFKRFFRALGVDAPFYIPDRLSEGYGPNINAFKNLKEQGVDILFVADCGTTSVEVIQAGRDLGLEIVIFDHHEAGEAIAPATHLINPKRADDHSGLEMLAACGVCFMGCVAMNRALREAGYYQDKEEPPLKDWLDLVALGTVCDMVPLTGANRLLVRAGLQQMAFHQNKGLQALCEVAQIEGDPTIAQIGWSLGPRINAGSRVHKSDLGAQLLSEEDLEEARAIAWTLEKCNEERKAIQSQMVKDAITKVEAQIIDRRGNMPLIFVADESYHPGLSGLAAGRLKDRFGRPAIVVTFAKNGDGTMEARASGRSIPGFSMADAFMAAQEAGLVIKGGGHAMAGGFSADPAKLEELEAFLQNYMAEHAQEFEQAKQTQVDSVATVRGAQVQFVHLLETQIGPFGMGNEPPVFALPNIRVHDIDVLKDKHIRLMLADWEGGSRMKAMLFGGVGTPLGDTLLKAGRGGAFHICGQFQINRWQGRESVEFHISDGAPAMAQGAEQVA